MAHAMPGTETAISLECWRIQKSCMELEARSSPCERVKESKFTTRPSNFIPTNFLPTQQTYESRPLLQACQTYLQFLLLLLTFTLILWIVSVAVYKLCVCILFFSGCVATCRLRTLFALRIAFDST